jgi:hypothetical protein
MPQFALIVHCLEFANVFHLSDWVSVNQTMLTIVSSHPIHVIIINICLNRMTTRPIYKKRAWWVLKAKLLSSVQTDPILPSLVAHVISVAIVLLQSHQLHKLLNRVRRAKQLLLYFSTLTQTSARILITDLFLSTKNYDKSMQKYLRKSW